MVCGKEREAHHRTQRRLPSPPSTQNRLGKGRIQAEGSSEVRLVTLVQSCVIQRPLTRSFTCAMECAGMRGSSTSTTCSTGKRSGEQESRELEEMEKEEPCASSAPVRFRGRVRRCRCPSSSGGRRGSLHQQELSDTLVRHGRSLVLLLLLLRLLLLR